MEMVLQVAVRDIGQLTDLARELPAAAETTGRSEKKLLKGAVDRSSGRALARSGVAGWPGGEPGETGLSPG
jgi:hypothetical protein